MAADCKVLDTLWNAGLIGMRSDTWLDPAVLAEHILDQLGMAKTATNIDQVAVMLAALRKFDERNNGQYHDLWRQYGAHDTARHARHKAMRAAQIATNSSDGNDYTFPDLIDDAIDGVNYFAFTVRNLLEGNYGDAD